MCLFCASGFALSWRCLLRNGSRPESAIPSASFIGVWACISTAGLACSVLACLVLCEFWYTILGFCRHLVGDFLGDKVMDSSWPASQIDPPIQPLTRNEAQALLARYPPPSLRQILLLQGLTGLVLSGLWWVFLGPAAFLSSLYGLMVVLVPNALMVRALTGSLGKSVGGLVLWELVKVVAAGCLLAVAPFVLPSLVWLALLATVVLCMKVMIAVSLWRDRGKKLNAVV